MSAYHKRMEKYYLNKVKEVLKPQYFLGFIPMPKHPETFAIAHYYLLSANYHKKKQKLKKGIKARA